jgi:membrane fusion protein, adhesin transport system
LRWLESLTLRPRLADFAADAEGMMEPGHSPLAGLLILVIAVVLAALLAWSALAGVEQVVRAVGTVEPADRVKIINHPDGGRVAAIHVTDGDRVVAGQPLLTFDAELVRAELAELRGRFQLRSAETARLEAEVGGGSPVFPDELATARPDLIALQTALLHERREAQASREETQARLVERRGSELRSLAAEVSRLRSSEDLLRQQFEAVSTLAEKGLYPRLRLVEVERYLSDVTFGIGEARERLAAAEAALAEARSRQQGLEREWRSGLLAELAATNAERNRLADALARQEALLRNLVLRAPVDGVIQDLMVAAPGQSVGSNQLLMKLVPTGGALVIEARIANDDIGWIRVGQPARVKVRTFDFLRFGTLEGEILRISADSTPDPGSGAPSYKVTVRTTSDRLGQGEAAVNVLPGMTVDVDLLVGERTVLSYLTDRILRLRADAFRQG